MRTRTYHGRVRGPLPTHHGLHKLSVSRWNHWLPRAHAHPEGVEGTAAFHHAIANAVLPQAEPVLHDATARDTAVDMLDPQPTLAERLVRPLLLPCALLAAWLLGRHEDLHLGQRERQKAQILQQPAPCGYGIGGRVGNALVVDTAAIRVVQKEDEEQGVDEEDIFYRIVFFLAAINLLYLRQKIL